MLVATAIVEQGIWWEKCQMVFAGQEVAMFVGLYYELQSADRNVGVRPQFGTEKDHRPCNSTYGEAQLYNNGIRK